MDVSSLPPLVQPTGQLGSTDPAGTPLPVASLTAPFPTPNPKATKTPAVVSCGTQFKVRLVGGNFAVNTGVPVGSVAGGWGINADHPKGFVASRNLSGEDCMCYTSVVIETYLAQFEPGRNYDIADIDDEGRLTFMRDDAGPYMATSESRILMQPPT